MDKQRDTFITLVIKNLFKTRDRMGYELNSAWQEMSDDEHDEHMEYAPSFNDLNEDEIEKQIKKLFKYLPHNLWDEENITDALYCEPQKVRDFLKKITHD